MVTIGLLCRSGSSLVRPLPCAPLLDTPAAGGARRHAVISRGGPAPLEAAGFLTPLQNVNYPAATPVADSSASSIGPQDYPKIVQFFRQASPYIAGHRGRTFVIVVPGNVS